MVRVSINKKPVDADAHTSLDYLELLALVNMDGVATLDGAADRYFDSPGEGRGDLSPTIDCEEDSYDGDGEGDVVAPVTRRKGAAKVAQRFRDGLALASWRAAVYSEDYPFDVAYDGTALQLKNSLSEKARLYLFLLLAANLPFVSPSSRTALTVLFEEVALASLASLMPAGAEVHAFGKASTTRYSGTAYEKLKTLCNDIRASLLVGEDDFRMRDSGDSGIDLVSWFGMGDSEPNIIVCLGQCACSRSEWPNKQLAASQSSLDYVKLRGGWSTAIFVPVCFRRIGGAWAVSTEISSVIFVDRLRIINSLKVEGLPFMSNIDAIVDDVKGSESIV